MTPTEQATPVYTEIVYSAWDRVWLVRWAGYWDGRVYPDRQTAERRAEALELAWVRGVDEWLDLAISGPTGPEEVA